MHEYMRNTTDTHRPIIDLVSLAMSGKGARYLSPEKAISLAKYAFKHKSAVTTAESYSYDAKNGEERVGDYNFFWQQSLPEGQSWTSFYKMLTERFIMLAETAKTSKFDEYFHVWVGMKGDENVF